MSRKVALVSHWDWVLWNYRMPLATALHDSGWEVILISPPGRYVEEMEKAGFRWIRWWVSRRGLNPVSEAKAVLSLLSIYRKERPELVHHFTIKPNLYGCIAMRQVEWGGSGNSPVGISTFTGLGFLFGSDAAARLLKALVKPLLIWAFRNPKVWSVFQTEADLHRLVGEGLVRAERSTVIAGSGVDTEELQPTHSRRPERAPVVLLAGRLLRDKGIGEFVEAASILRRSGVAVEFWLAGVPDFGNPSSIPEDEVGGWHESGVIRWLGHVDDIPDLLARVDIAVLPSYSEGVPLFLLEAAACGLPLVASDIEGCRAVVEQGVNGMLVPPRDPGALAAAIETLLEDCELREAMGQESRRIAVERFDSRAVVGEFLALYEKVLGYAGPLS